MPAPPLPVSVVIPAFRRPDMVERAMRSVQQQRCPPAEVIVVDDASGDDTGARAADLGARVVTRDRNGGEGAARNSGLQAASHQWVALLDCDDEWLPDHLATLWPARDGHVLVGSAVLLRPSDPAGERAYGWAGRRPRVLRGPADVAVPENKLAASAVMLRRDVALEAGGFRANMPRAADLDMWIRLLELGTGLAIPLVTAVYHVHSGQVSTDPEQMRDAHRAVLDDHADRPWHTVRLRRRQEGALAWDVARASRASGTPAGVVGLRLVRSLASGASVVGIAQLLVGRRGRRRLARAAARTDPRVRWRRRWLIERVLVRVLGRRIRCASCGRTLFRAIPVVWRGEVRLVGAYEHLVSAGFRWTDTLELRHVHLDECPTPERPWMQ